MLIPTPLGFDQARSGLGATLHFRGAERVLDQRLLLLHMQLHVAGSSGGRGRTTGVAQHMLLLQRLLETMPYLVPGTLVARFLLAPDDVARVRIPGDDLGVLGLREWV